MNKRDYYSVRTGKIKPNQEIYLETLKRLFLIIYKKLDEEGYFQRYFGFHCVEEGDITGELGHDIGSIFFINLKKDNLYPIKDKIGNYDENDLFDVIELIHDYCSKGIDGGDHSSFGCVYHYTSFKDKEGQKYFRKLINPTLKSYGNRYELSEDGEILQLADPGLSKLFDADVPTDDKENIEQKVEQAIIKFRRYKSTTDDRRDAIRDLVDVLEFLRPKAKQYLDKKDEVDLFNIANNYGIRHHNDKQKNNYDKSIWLSWMFYLYLATIHALLRIIKKNE